MVWDGTVYRPLPDRLAHLTLRLADRPPAQSQSRVHFCADDLSPEDDGRRKGSRRLDAGQVAAVVAGSVFDLAKKA